MENKSVNTPPKKYNFDDYQSEFKSLDTASLPVDSPYTSEQLKTVHEYTGRVYNDLEYGLKQRAENQSILEQANRAVGKGVAKGVLTFGENVGYLLDIPEWFNGFSDIDDQHGNFLSEKMVELKGDLDENFEIYRTNPDKIFDFTDSGSWFQQVEGLIDSTVGFGLTGAALGIGIGGAIGSTKAGLSAVNKAAQFANKFLGTAVTNSQLAGAITTIGSAVASNYVESKMMGVETYNEVYKEAKLKGLSDDKAHSLASKAGKEMVLNNKVNIIQEAFQLNAIFKGSQFTRGAEKVAFKKKLQGYALDAVGEAYEEVSAGFIQKEATDKALNEIDYHSEKSEDLYLKRALNYATSPEGILEGTLGAIGGPFQHIATKGAGFVYNKVTGREAIDPEAQDNYLSDSYRERLDNTVKKTKEFHEAKIKAIKEGDETKIKEIEKEEFHTLLKSAFANRTTGVIEDYLKEKVNKGTEEEKQLASEHLITLKKEELKFQELAKKYNDKLGSVGVEMIYDLDYNYRLSEEAEASYENEILQKKNDLNLLVKEDALVNDILLKQESTKLRLKELTKAREKLGENVNDLTKNYLDNQIAILERTSEILKSQMDANEEALKLLDKETSVKVLKGLTEYKELIDLMTKQAKVSSAKSIHKASLNNFTNPKTIEEYNKSLEDNLKEFIDKSKTDEEISYLESFLRNYNLPGDFPLAEFGKLLKEKKNQISTIQEEKEKERERKDNLKKASETSKPKGKFESPSKENLKEGAEIYGRDESGNVILRGTVVKVKYKKDGEPVSIVLDSEEEIVAPHFNTVGVKVAVEEEVSSDLKDNDLSQKPLSEDKKKKELKEKRQLVQDALKKQAYEFKNKTTIDDKEITSVDQDFNEDFSFIVDFGAEVFERKGGILYQTKNYWDKSIETMDSSIDSWVVDPFIPLKNKINAPITFNIFTNSHNFQGKTQFVDFNNSVNELLKKGYSLDETLNTLGTELLNLPIEIKVSDKEGNPITYKDQEVKGFVKDDNVHLLLKQQIVKAHYNNEKLISKITQIGGGIINSYVDNSGSQEVFKAFGKTGKLYISNGSSIVDNNGKEVGKNPGQKGRIYYYDKSFTHPSGTPIPILLKNRTINKEEAESIFTILLKILSGSNPNKVYPITINDRLMFNGLSLNDILSNLIYYGDNTQTYPFNFDIKKKTILVKLDQGDSTVVKEISLQDIVADTNGILKDKIIKYLQTIPRAVNARKMNTTFSEKVILNGNTYEKGSDYNSFLQNDEVLKTNVFLMDNSIVRNYFIDYNLNPKPIKEKREIVVKEEPKIVEKTEGFKNFVSESTQHTISQEDKKADIERRRQEEFDQYENNIIVKTELYEDGEGRKYLVHTLKNGKKRLDTADEEGKRTSSIDVYESSVPVENYIMEAKKISDIEVKPSKQENRINAKYDAELAALENINNTNQITQQTSITFQEDPVEVNEIEITSEQDDSFIEESYPNIDFETSSVLDTGLEEYGNVSYVSSDAISNLFSETEKQSSKEETTEGKVEKKELSAKERLIEKSRLHGQNVDLEISKLPVSEEGQKIIQEAEENGCLD